MYSAAVNLALLLVFPTGSQGKDVQAAWKTVAPSVVRIRDGVSVVGSAVLIDSSGYFLAHRSTTGGLLLSGVSAKGESMPLTRVSSDDATGLVLLRASGWSPSDAKPIQSIVSMPKAGTPVFIVMSDGLETGEISNPSRSGVLPRSRRMVFLTEVKLEHPTPNLGGAPVFTFQGEFVGLLNANLQSSSARQTQTQGAGLPQNTFAGGKPQLQKNAPTAQNYGPSPMFVAYAIGPEMLQRVISGFLSPSHQVQHPFIGLYLKDSSQGAEVQAVNPTSPAAAELQPGDLILSVGGTAISSRQDYARALLHLHVGDPIAIILVRQGREKTVYLKVAAVPL